MEIDRLNQFDDQMVVNELNSMMDMNEELIEHRNELYLNISEDFLYHDEVSFRYLTKV